MSEPARERPDEGPLTREQLFGWLARMLQRDQEAMAREAEESECTDSKASE